MVQKGFTFIGNINSIELWNLAMRAASDFFSATSSSKGAIGIPRSIRMILRSLCRSCLGISIDELLDVFEIIGSVKNSSIRKGSQFMRFMYTNFNRRERF